jgi:quinol monooxygenase YgiN
MTTTFYAMATYRPHEGKETAFQTVLDKHIPTLRAEGLITDSPTLLLKSENGTLIEIFEWKSSEAIDAAHQNAAVQVIWNEMMEIADFPPLSTLPEAGRPFADFRPVTK